MSSIPYSVFCPQTGEPHSQHPSSFAFCPSCRCQLQHGTPVRKKESKDIIVLDDTPDTKRAIFVPATKAIGRTVAENARQQSIHKTSQLAIRGPMKLPILLHACLVRFEVINQGSWQREKFLDFEVLRTLELPYCLQPAYKLIRENSTPSS
jgi:hypothetical protein